MKTASIKFVSTWVDANGMARREAAEFKLGDGPCGKTVSNLIYTIEAGCLCIYQQHTDGTSKDFAYQLRDICGRIEVENDA